MSWVRPGAAGAAWALLAGSLLLPVTACSGGPIAQVTPAGGSDYVTGSAASHYYPAGSRPLAPKVTGNTLTDQRFSLVADRGSVVVLNFWGSWCPPCRREAPALASLARLLGCDGVRFVGVDIRDTVPGAEAFEQTFGIGYPSLNDPGGLVALAFHGTVPPNAFPCTLVIDRTGHIAASVFGEVSEVSRRPRTRKTAAVMTQDLAGHTPAAQQPDGVEPAALAEDAQQALPEGIRTAGGSGGSPPQASIAGGSGGSPHQARTARFGVLGWLRWGCRDLARSCRRRA
jgi:thiol-disulfide isomerase/thioredoxin